MGLRKTGNDVCFIALLRRKNLQKTGKSRRKAVFRDRDLWRSSLRKMSSQKKSAKKVMHTYISTHLFRAVGAGGRGGPLPPILPDKLTLSHPGGRLCPLHYHLPNPGFSNLPKALLFLHNC